jgi:hypothetical protein
VSAVVPDKLVTFGLCKACVDHFPEEFEKVGLQVDAAKVYEKGNFFTVKL